MDLINIIQIFLFIYVIGKEVMENYGCAWDSEEDKQLIKLYSKYKMEITEIADIHKRSVSVIKKRIEILGISNVNDFTLDNIFFMVRNATFGIDEKSRQTVMNDLCHTLVEQWSIPKEILAKNMDIYNFEYHSKIIKYR